MVCDSPVCIYSQRINQVAVLDHSELCKVFRICVLLTNISAVIITFRDLNFKCMVDLYPRWIYVAATTASTVSWCDPAPVLSHSKALY